MDSCWTSICPPNHLSFICLSYAQPYFGLDNWSKYQWIFTKLVCALVDIVCALVDIVRSCLGLLIGKFHQFLTELHVYACHTMVVDCYRFTLYFKITENFVVKCQPTGYPLKKDQRGLQYSFELYHSKSKRLKSF